jgi:DNA-binding beta-propeller fold protein YncE
MSHRTNARVIVFATALTIAGSAQAASLRQIGTISIPGEPLQSYDLGYVDQRTNRYYLTDRANKSIDIFDAINSSFISRVSGFVGPSTSGATNGPNGISVVNNGTEVWASDGDSTVKVVDLKTMKIVDTISVGGKGRANATEYDPKDQILITGMDNDTPPYITLISTKPGHEILGKIVVERANRIDALLYYAPTGMFYVSLPVLDKTDHRGGIGVLDPRAGKIVRIIEVNDCVPQGLALGPNSHVVIGCNAGSKESKLPPLTAVLDLKTEKVIATTDKVGGSDMSAYNPKLGLYILGAREAPDGPSIGIIDAKTDKWVENIPAPPNPHSVAVSNVNGHVFVPSAKTGGSCDGCILVFGPE